MSATLLAPTIDTAPVVTLGANFEGVNALASGFLPPDSDGAIGPNQFVELVNGAYGVYDRSGTLLQASSLQDFWSNAGVTPPGTAFDPRVLYDPASERWFAASAAASNLMLAVSNTSDPTQGWHAFSISADPTGQTFVDFPRLGLNNDGVYLAATMIPFSPSQTSVTLVAVPESDLLGPSPTAANATVFGNASHSEFGLTLQPAIAPVLGGVEPLLGIDIGSPVNVLKISSIDGPITSPTLDGADRLIDVMADPLGSYAVQKGSTVLVVTGDTSFSSSVVWQDDKLFAVRTVAKMEGGGPALQWFEIGNPLTAPVVLDTGLISPPGLDVYYGSIAVNPIGEVVIGFSGSGPDDHPSAYTVAGTLNGDVLQFGDPMLLKAGTAPSGERFGDYSATTYDPSDPSHFWTVQEWSSASGWSTEISEIIFAPPTPTLQTWFGGRGDFSDPQNWVPPGSPAATDTLVIDAGRAVADNLTIANPTIELGSPTTPPTLVLRDSTLGATSHIHVQTTTFDASQPDIAATIRVAGATTEDGSIDVGTTGLDPNQLFPAHLTVGIARGSSLTLDPGALWVSGDGSTLDVNGPKRDDPFVNNGEVEAFGGTVCMNVPVAGQGTFDVLFNKNDILAGTLEFTKGVGAGETVKLDAGLLILDQPEHFLASIQDFNAAGTIELAHTNVTSADYSNGVLTLFDKHRVAAELNIVGDFTTEQFSVTEQNGNAFITLDPSPPGSNLDKQVAQLVSAMAAPAADAADPGAPALPTENASTLQPTLALAGHS